MCLNTCVPAGGTGECRNSSCWENIDSLCPQSLKRDESLTSLSSLSVCTCTEGVELSIVLNISSWVTLTPRRGKLRGINLLDGIFFPWGLGSFLCDRRIDEQFNSYGTTLQKWLPSSTWDINGPMMCRTTSRPALLNYAYIFSLFESKSPVVIPWMETSEPLVLLYVFILAWSRRMNILYHVIFNTYISFF